MDAAQRFLFVLGSTRVGGNSERLARAAATHLPPGATARWERLIDDPLPPFFDTRHSTGYAPPAGAGLRWVEATLAATDLVIVTPVNWYSVAWPVKLYLDHMSGWMRVPELAFAKTMAGRSLWAVVVDSDDEAAGTAAPVVDAWRRTVNVPANRPSSSAIQRSDGPPTQVSAVLSAAHCSTRTGSSA